MGSTAQGKLSPHGLRDPGTGEAPREGQGPRGAEHPSCLSLRSDDPWFWASLRLQAQDGPQPHLIRGSQGHQAGRGQRPNQGH